MEARNRGFSLTILTQLAAELKKALFLGIFGIGGQTQPIEPFTLFSD